MQDIDTDPEQITELLTRTTAEIFPSTEALQTTLSSGRRLRVYVGMDATGPQLHLGHAAQLLLLERFRQLGHETIVLFGDFTARIGDPAGRSAARTQLTEQTVHEHLVSWRDQVAKIIPLDGHNPAVIRQNSEWLGQLTFTDVTTLAAQFTVQHMLERDMFKRRLQDEQPIYLHEFLYPLMQGYDSVALDVDVEIGATDQTFNMLAGRALQKKYTNTEKYVVTTNLLVDPDTGTKLMSKSEGKFIALNDEPDEVFGKTMALPDGAIIPVMTACTTVPRAEIQKVENELASGANPRDKKLQLATELVTLLYDTTTAQQAHDRFIQTFSRKQGPEHAPSVTVSPDTSITELLEQSGAAPSRSQARRLVAQGAVAYVHINGSEEKITDPDIPVRENSIVRAGKKQFFSVSVK